MLSEWLISQEALADFPADNGSERVGDRRKRPNGLIRVGFVQILILILIEYDYNIFYFHQTPTPLTNYEVYIHTMSAFNTDINAERLLIIPTIGCSLQYFITFHRDLPSMTLQLLFQMAKQNVDSLLEQAEASHTIIS
jgi:hypothetical protein